MILVTGGAFQGKLEYAFRLLGRESADRKAYADGSLDDMETAFLKPVVYDFHLYIRRMTAEHIDAETYIGELLLQNPQCIIVMDEVGCGVVPIDKNDRAYREAVGEAGQLLASHASQVHHVICGIGNRIK